MSVEKSLMHKLINILGRKLVVSFDSIESLLWQNFQK